MKHQTIAFCLFLVAICQISMASPDNIKSVVQGRISNVPKGYYIYLSDPIHKVLVKSPVENGIFKLECTVPQVGYSGTLTIAEIYFTQDPNLDRVQLVKVKTRGPNIILEENVTITGDLKSNHFRLQGRYNDRLDMFLVLKNEVSDEMERRIALIKNAAYTADEKGKREFSIRAYSDSKLKLKQLDLVVQLRDKVALDQLFFQAYSTFYGYQAVENAFKNFSDSLRQSETGKKINLAIEKRKESEKNYLKIGDPFPILSLPDETGKVFNMANRAPGLYLIDIWASWCGPCRAEIPYIKDAQKKYNHLKVIAISIDEDHAKWKSAISNDGTNGFLQLLDNKGWKSETVKKLSIYEIPQNFLVNEKGIIVAKNIRNEDIIASVAKEDSKLNP